MRPSSTKCKTMKLKIPRPTITKMKIYAKNYHTLTNNQNSTVRSKKF